LVWRIPDLPATPSLLDRQADLGGWESVHDCCWCQCTIVSPCSLPRPSLSKTRHSPPPIVATAALALGFYIGGEQLLITRPDLFSASTGEPPGRVPDQLRIDEKVPLQCMAFVSAPSARVACLSPTSWRLPSLSALPTVSGQSHASSIQGRPNPLPGHLSKPRPTVPLGLSRDTCPPLSRFSITAAEFDRPSGPPML